MSTPYVAQQPVNDFGLRFSDLQYSVTTIADTNYTFTVPGNAPSYKAVIKASGECWMALNDVAELPDPPVDVYVLVQTNSEMLCNCNVVCREVNAGDVINFISAAPVDIGVVLYVLRTNN